MSAKLSLTNFDVVGQTYTVTPTQLSYRVVMILKQVIKKCNIQNDSKKTWFKGFVKQPEGI